MIGKIDVGGLISLLAVIALFLLARSRGKSLRASANATAYASGFGAGVASASAAASAVNSTHVHVGHRVGNDSADYDQSTDDHDHDRSIGWYGRQPMRDSIDVERRIPMGELSGGNEPRRVQVGRNVDTVDGARRIDRVTRRHRNEGALVSDLVDDENDDT